MIFSWDMLTWWFNIFVGLFVIIDPFAVAPVYLSLSDRFTSSDMASIRMKAAACAFLILVVFCVFGNRLFSFFGITAEAFQIAGGILLLVYGVAQMTSERSHVDKNEAAESEAKDDISIFPLATPLLAGPGAISSVVLHTSKATNIWEKTLVGVAIGCVLLLTLFILKFSPSLLRVLGRTGLNLLTRIMGVILTAIAVQFILSGLKTALGI
jgi:multiple antibiotic resistance protein